MDEIDPRVIDYCLGFLERRLPQVKIGNTRHERRNVVHDIMYIGRYMKWVEPPPSENETGDDP